MESADTRRPVIRFPRLRRLARDTEGAAVLETVIVLPVLLLFMLVLIEMSLLANARQLANYAAFSAARTAAVQGVDSTARAKVHLAAAMAMTTISPPQPRNAPAVLSAYGMEEPNKAIKVLCDIPGFETDTINWRRRLADAFIRTGEPACSTGTVSGKTRKHVVVNVTYIYRCNILPLGIFWGHSRLDSYITMLEGLAFYDVISAVATQIKGSWRWNVPIHGRAVTEYWAD